MTKQEAIELENKCDKLMSEALGRDCICCMALCGNLKIIIENKHYITLDKYDNFNVDYISFTGDYWRLQEYIEKVEECFRKNKDTFMLLLMSYEWECGKYD